jgi:hypothetical protein
LDDQGPRRLRALVLASSALLLGAWTIRLVWGPDVVAADTPSAVQVLTADASGFTVDLRLPEPAAERAVRAGTSCIVPLLAALPAGPAPVAGEVTYGWLVGVPEPEGAAVRADLITEVPWGGHRAACAVDTAGQADRVTVGRSLAEVTITGPESRPPPGVALPLRWAPVASLEPVGALRELSLARLVVRPLARDAEGHLVFRTRIRLRVDYRHVASVRLAAPRDNSAFAAMREVLLNLRFLPQRVDIRTGRLARQDTQGSAGSDPPWVAPAEPLALKLMVDRDGPVVVTGADLARAGWDLAATDPATLGLWVAGRPAGFSIAGLVDGHLAPASRLVFQGRAMTGLYTRENVYWLVPDGFGLAMSERDGSPRMGTPARAFTETLHFEQDTRWFASLNPRDGDDRWMWGDPLNAADASRRALTVTLPVANLAAEGAAGRIRIQFQGFTADANVAPDHHVKAVLNDRPLGESWFDGLGVHIAAFEVPAGVLRVGENRLMLQTVGVTGALVDQFYLNRIALETRAGYRATGDRLDFAGPAASAVDQAFVLTGFTVPDVTVLEVTDPVRPVRLTGAAVARAGDGTYDVRFRDSGPAGRRYVAFGPGAARPPLRIVPNAASDWRSGLNGADWVVLTHPDFAGALQPLVERRRAQGLRTAVVDINDVYDEFSYGVFDPRAIRAFVQHAYWQWRAPASTYVLLVGEANLDYRRGYNSGPANFVPSVTLDEVSGGGELTAYMSDQWFARVGDDPVPDVLLGRFSVSTPGQARTIVDKTLRYEDQPLGAPWRRRAALVADDTDAALMERLSEDLAHRLPVGSDVRRFYAARYPVTRSISADIAAAVDGGVTLLSFVGHGNVALWSPWPGGGFIFDNTSIARLANGDAMPIFTAATCMNGWVDHPLKPVSMAELWLTHPGGGGPVAWAPSGFSSLSAQSILFPVLFDGLYDGRVRPIGALVATAAATALGQSAGYADAVSMLVLLGDPALPMSGAAPLPTATPAPTPAGVYLPYAGSRAAREHAGTGRATGKWPRRLVDAP